MEVGQEWSSFNGVNSINEEANFMAQLFQDSLTSSCYSGMSNGDDNVSVFLTDLSQGSSNYSGSGPNATATGCSNSNSNSNSSSTTSTVAYPFQGTYCLSDAYEFFPVEYYPSANKNFVHYFPCNNSMETSVEMGYGEDHQPTLSNTQLQLKQEYDHISEIEPGSEDVKCNDSVENGGRKRSRIIEKGKRNIRTKKNQKTSSDDEDNNVSETHHHPTQCIPLIENNVPEIHRQNSGSSEEDYNGVAACSSLSSKGAATINSNGKTRASRGAATDPQSIYARKRRERINERLRILQNLVPNGTKVDISTMLEEAVQYVKFLQLQIKLLSSDDLWMYAPLAYNGMDIGLDSKIRALL